MKSINKILMKAKLKNYKKKYKEREQEQVLDLNNQASKCMANTSFYSTGVGYTIRLGYESAKNLLYQVLYNTNLD